MAETFIGTRIVRERDGRRRGSSRQFSNFFIFVAPKCIMGLENNNLHV